MKTLKVLGRILSIAITVILGLLLVSNLYSIAARLVTKELQPDVFGFSTAVVISGSMSGSIEVNDMVVIRRQNGYEIGDVVTFETDGSLVTHRIIDRTERGFTTRGDANNSPDLEPVQQEQIVGRVVLVIPKIGKAIEFMRTPLGMTCLVLVGVALVEVPVLIRRRSEESGGMADDEKERKAD